MRNATARRLPYLLGTLFIGLGTTAACVGDDPAENNGTSTSSGTTGSTSSTSSSSGSASSSSASSGSTASSSSASSSSASSSSASSSSGSISSSSTSTSSTSSSSGTVQYQLGVTIDGPTTGAGSVTSAPAGITCGSTCQAPFNTGTSVELTATTLGGSSFLGWTKDGATCGSTSTCSVNMTAAKNVGALFAEPKAGAWVQSVSSVGGDADAHAALDKDGNILFATNFGGSFVFGGKTYSTGNLFVAKLSPSGAVLWAKTFGGSGVDSISDIAVSRTTGDVALVGVSSSTSTDFGGGIMVATDGEDPFVVKLSGVDGTARWARTFTANNDDGANTGGVAMDGLGNVYVIGNFYTSINFNDGTSALGTANETNTFIAKLASSDGSTTSNGWKKVLAAQSFYGRKIIADSANDIVIAGYFSGTVDFDTTPTTPAMLASGSYDGLVAKFTGLSGAWAWQKQVSTTADDEVVSAALVSTTTNDIVVAARMTATAGTTPSFAGTSVGSPSAGGAEVVIARLASGNGAVAWAKRYGGTGQDYAYDIAVLGPDHYAITGYSTANITFDAQPAIPFAGTGGDGWFAVLDGAGAPVATWSFKPSSANLDAGQVVLGRGKLLYGFGKFIGDASILGTTVTNLGNYDTYLFGAVTP